MQIERGIPIPPKPTTAITGRAPMYPWGAMAIGDSVFVVEQTRSAVSSASQYGQRRGKVFTSRSVDGGVRVWRVS